MVRREASPRKTKRTQNITKSRRKKMQGRKLNQSMVSWKSNMNGKDYIWWIHHMAWCIHTFAKSCLKDKQEKTLTFPSAPKIAINHKYQATMSQVQPFQVAINWFMACENWLLGPAWITYIYTNLLLCDSIAKALIPPWQFIAMYIIIYLLLSLGSPSLLTNGWSIKHITLASHHPLHSVTTYAMHTPGGKLQIITATFVVAKERHTH